MSQAHDLIVIGAGSGGVAAARRAALHGARVAIVEGGRVGGTCVIRGCVPKKLLMYAAAYADDFADARGYGWVLEPPPRFEMARWAAAKAAETARLEGVYRRLIQEGGVELVEGWGLLDGRDGDAPEAALKVRVGERVLRGRHVLLAAGAAPVRDSLPGIGHCATSDELLDLAELPARAAVVGAGYIAVEFASMLARLGVQVEMFYRGGLPLRGFDTMLREAAAEALADAGVLLHPGRAPQQVSAQGRRLHFDDGSHAEFPWVLNATGRRANGAALGLASLGLAPGTRGEVVVGQDMGAGAPGLWAIGDLTDRRNLTPVAIAEGRALADRLFGPADAVHPDLSRVASAVFMLPPLASIGPTEDEAVAAGRRVAVYETAFRPMQQAFAGGRGRTRMKLLVDAGEGADSGRVLALHMAGADAPEIVQSLAVALSAGATKAHFDRTVAVHPTAAEEWVLLRAPSRVREPG